MKRLLILLTILMASTSWAQCTEQAPCPELARLSPAIVGGGVPAAGGLACTVGSGDNWVNTSTADFYIITATNSHQKVANASSIELCQINVTLRFLTTSGDVHLEVWSDPDMLGTQYGSDSNVCTVDSTPEVCVFTFATNPEPPGAFYVFFIEESGNLLVYSSAAAASQYFGGTNYDLTSSGSLKDLDACMSIYYMQ